MRLERLPRYESTTTTLMGQPLEIVDAASFLGMHREIIDEGIYFFDSTNESPYIIDAGANIGISVLYFKSLYPRAHIVAFEPDPNVFAVLKRNIERHGHDDVELVSVALAGAASTEVPFMEEGSWGGRIARGTDPSAARVETRSLRPYLEAGRVDLLKMNIEGEETEVLVDCSGLLANVDRIVLEYHSFGGEKQSLHTLLGVLADAGYRVYVRSVSASWPNRPFEMVTNHAGMDLQLYVYASRVGDTPPLAARQACHQPALVTPREGFAAILMYHRINQLGVDPHRLCVPPAEFREHMRYLVARHPVLPLDRLARGVLDGTLPERAVAVTFDDGTLDALESASPVLTELGIPATFFVNVEHIDEEHEPWWDVLARILLDPNETPAVLEWSLDGSKRTLSTGSASERASAYTAIHRALMHATRPERERVLGELVDWSGQPQPARASHRLLLPHEVRELGERPGHAIGAHSVSHLRLPLQPAEEQDWEIGASRRELERITGRPVTLFSYPYGGYDRDTVERVRRAGFRAAVTTEPGVVTIGDDVRSLPRIEVKSGGVAELARALDEALCRH